MREKRGAYRTKEGLEEIKVSVARLGGEYLEGVLIDLSARGTAVAVAVPSARLAALPLGTTVQLRFDIAGLAPIADIVAVVRNERDSDGRRVFGLEIIDWRTLHDRLPPRLFAAFNRRAHYRVPLPSQPETKVSVTLTESERACTATLADISVSGCLLLFPAEELPQTGAILRLKFCLPGSDIPLNLLGTARSAAEFKDAVRCGVEFEVSRSREFLAHQQQISRYVMKRQRELKDSEAGSAARRTAAALRS